MNYDWPGNVRELKSVINRACTNVQKGNIEDGDIIFMAHSGPLRPSPDSLRRVSPEAKAAVLRKMRLR